MSEQILDNKIKDTEKRKERFKKLASKRTTRILRLLNLLENCANKTNYYYTEDQVDKIFSTIEKRLQDVKEQFKSTANNKNTIKFEL